MSGEALRIAVVAPSTRFAPEAAERVRQIAARLDPAPAIYFHPQCFESFGHFAGDDATRAAALIEVAESDAFDAVWFARGGYGAGRLLERVMPALGPAARAKTWLGYSDAGALLGAFYKAGFAHLAHGPVAQEALREGGEAAVVRALTWLTRRDPATLEPSLAADPRPAAAFNLSILASLVGTPWQPDLAGHVLMVEDVGEYMYRLDRLFFQITSNPDIRRVAGLRLGRCSDIPENDPDFVLTEEDVARSWCERSGIPYLGRADIGHDIANKIVPFGPR
ncbi:MAG TPA: LD-carboxypeptidase [Caulobacteraceae bacterium]|nr:LD-carboxypeptidase [Caulobacteraceae bacterium]